VCLLTVHLVDGFSIAARVHRATPIRWCTTGPAHDTGPASGDQTPDAQESTTSKRKGQQTSE